MEGEVSFFHDKKKYGFITPEEGEDDLFFHISDVEGESISEGDKVNFETEEAEKGPRAVKITLM